MALSKGEVMPHPDLNALSAFIDGRLSEADRAGVVAHLSGCPECRAIVAAHARGQQSRARFRPALWLPIAATLALATTAALIVSRSDRAPEGPSPAPPIAAPPSATPADSAPQPSPPPASTASTPPASTVPPPADPGSLAVRRGAVQQINGKTFRMVAGEWIDSAYDPLALWPVQEIAGAEARAALLARVPLLAPYAALGPRVTVAHDGAVYQFRP
jgi:anti-sigma factor RsiW